MSKAFFVGYQRFLDTFRAETVPVYLNLVSESEQAFDFTSDWFSQNIPVWEKFLKPLADRPLAALEIGCFEGRATVWLLQNVLTHPDSYIRCVDTFAGDADLKARGIDFSRTKQQFLNNTSKWGSRVLLFNDSSMKHFKIVRKHYDLIYVDGDHAASAIHLDIAFSWSRLAKNGILILDDYLWGIGKPVLETPRPAIDAFLTIFQGQYELLHKEYQIIVRKLRKTA